MPFLKFDEEKNKAPLTGQIDQDVLDDVKLYAKFLKQKSVPRVIQEILRKVMAGDKEFKAYKASVAAPASISKGKVA